MAQLIEALRNSGGSMPPPCWLPPADITRPKSHTNGRVLHELSSTGFAQVVDSINAAGGQPVVLTIADDEANVSQLERLFNGQRETEWAEFLADCGKYERELAGEVAKGKPSLAELDEEEQSLDRLRCFYRTIRIRDLYGAPSAATADRRLKECAEALEDFAEQVYRARERP